MNNKLSKTLAQKLLELHKSDLPIGKFKAKADKELIESLEEDGIISLYKHGKTFYLHLNDKQALQDFIRQNFNIASLESYVNESAGTRSEAALYSGYSKNLLDAVVSGFFIRALKPVEVKIGLQEFDLAILKGSALYVDDYEVVCLPKDVLVVGIENFETFMRIQNYAYFNHLEAVFLWRGNSKKAVQWLNTLTNDYLHFGDFDLSGIAIYITEFRNKLVGNRKIDFYIPDNIEDLIIKYGNADLYVKQLNDRRLQNIDFSAYPEVKPLYEIILKHRKVLEQEILEKVLCVGKKK